MFKIIKNGNVMKIEDAIQENYQFTLDTLMYRGINKQDSEDILQDACLKLLDRSKKNDQDFKDVKQFKKYMIWTALNLFVDGKRREKWYKFIPMEDSVIQWLSDMENEDPSEEDVICKKESIDRAKEALLLIDPNLRSVMILRMNGWSFKEIAEEEECSLNTALGRFRYARRNLKKLLT